MLFNSIEYLIFFPTVFILYWLLNKDLKKQNLLLLVASYFFYAYWDWTFLSLIIYSSFIDYYIGIKIYETDSVKAKKNWLRLSLVSNLGLLAAFKYFNFFTESFAEMMLLFGWQVDAITLNIILPVGISFYTFQTLSYTIDIYRGNFKPTKDIIAFFTFVSLFPQLVAGPIERASNLLPQIEKVRKFKQKWFHDGIFQITVGLFRKVVIADNLGIYVDSIYASPDVHNSSTLLLATVFYAYQIYFDFAGYSDIAIGSAKLLGFKFNQNFKLPYFSNSIADIWQRWHISLSSWLRDYLYYSLGGSRGSAIFTFRNLMITMIIGGLWHGNTWNFAIWGAIHGLLLVGEKIIFLTLKIKNAGWIGYIYPFCVVLLSWVFFRAQDFETAIQIIKKLIFFEFKIPFVGDINAIVTGLAMLAIGMSFDLYLFKTDKDLETLGRTFSPLKLGVIVSAIILLTSLFYSTSNNFIYFQF
ncbi:MBOAT family O-acyltransferase [Lacinutrix himadriensis]|uniref:MBOAT family O-acyltransferase n=1 Tax=Lacinutrix himadriensis TaxID=641549 RepID=UPI0006E4186D|nr:MBOAT family O-acyltransferase [Lacinutrix himadriensis]